MKPGDLGWRGRIALDSMELGRVRKDPPKPQSYTLTIPTPSKIEFVIFKSDQQDAWHSRLVVTALDVETGKEGTFGSNWVWAAEPTNEQLHKQLVDFLAHEMRHQLKLPTHPDGDEDSGFPDLERG